MKVLLIFAFLSLSFTLPENVEANKNTDPIGGTSISKFEADKKLSADDINFLNVIVNGNADIAAASRGVQTVRIGNREFTEGTVINQQDADRISAIIDAYAEDNPGLVSRGGEVGPSNTRYCFYRCWYWYCDYWGNCWRVWYCC